MVDKIKFDRIRTNYIDCMREYANAFSEATGYKGWFIGNSYELFGDEETVWSMNDVRYIVDNYDTLRDKWDGEEEFTDALVALHAYNTRCCNVGVEPLGITAYLKGEVKMNYKGLEELEKMRKSMDQLIKEHNFSVLKF